MAKITYLFGAGASRNALPIIKEIPDRLERLISIVHEPEYCLDNSYFSDKEGINKKTKRQYQSEMIETLQWLWDKSKGHASVDTFAKKLFIKGQTADLKKLKIALSIFFACEQAIKPPDIRYDSFFSSIMERSINLPENIRIITWNYDYQFEISFSEYSDQKIILHNQPRLNTQLKNFINVADPGFCIIKLNGTAGLFSQGAYAPFLYTDYNGPFSKDFIEIITQRYALISSTSTFLSTFFFSWEESFDPDRDIVKLAIKNTSDSQVLIVIGYSFPFFNRNVDRQIIKSMKELKKVYFQAPDSDLIKERFQAIRDDIPENKLVPRIDIEQFLLPNEL
jgi:hypothetical protein